MKERFGSANPNALLEFGPSQRGDFVLSRKVLNRSTRSRPAGTRRVVADAMFRLAERNHLEERVNPGNRGQWTGRSAGIAWTFGQSTP